MRKLDYRWGDVRRIASTLMALGVAVALAAVLSACAARGSSRTDVRAGLAFTRTDGRRYAVWVAQADGSHPRKIAPRAFRGALSPDGRWLAYSLPQDKPSSGLNPLYVVDLSGGDPRRLGEASAPEWLPHGARLAVSDGKTLFLVDVTSGKRRELLRGGHFYSLSFRPDGKALAFVRANDKVGPEYRSDIFVVRLADGRITRLTRDGHSDDPVWGRGWIVYRHFRWEAGSIFSIGELRLMRPDGSGERFFARGDENRLHAHYGLDPLVLSADGKRLLACVAAEFGCAPVTFTVPDGKEYKLSSDVDRVRVRDAEGELSTAADLARDGSEVLVDVGPFDGDTGHRVYAIPFEGGKPRVLVRDAINPSWAR